MTANLVYPYATRLNQKIDILVFNPPYVPTHSDEAIDAQSTANISGAWAGGKSGMQVTDIILDQLDVSA